MASESVRLHLGCGDDRWPGWINVDRQAGPAVDLVCDMRELAQHFEPGTVDAIHLMHALNYLTLWEARAFFATCRALLKPGGELVIETVDAAKAAARILDAMGKDFAAYLEGIRAFPGFGLDHLHAQQPYTSYSMAWTPWHLQEELRSAGFARSQITPPRTHAAWRDFRCEAFVAAAPSMLPTSVPRSPMKLKPMQVLFVVDEEAGHVTAHLRARLFVQPLAARGIQATVMDVRQDLRAIVSAAAASDVVVATKVRSLPIMRQLKAAARGPVLFDFTDALWLPQHQAFGWQDLHTILAEADALLCDNSVIAEYAREHNPRVSIWPVCSSVEQFDAARARRVPATRSHVRLGWVGSRGTATGVRSIADALRAVAQSVPNLELRVLGCDAHDVPQIDGLRVTARPSYDEAAMIDEVLDFDIGLFPAPSSLEDYRNRGPLKGLIYMSAGVPMVCERGGVLDEVVSQGVNGFTAHGTEEWTAHLLSLVTDAGRRAAIGAEARKAMDAGTLQHVTGLLARILTEARAAHRALPVVPTLATSSARKPRVLIIADVPGWIFERHARTLQQRLADAFDIVVGFRGEAFDEAAFDLIYPLEYDLVPPQRITQPWKYVTSLRSHISWDGVPPELLSGYLSSHYQQVHVVSQRLHALFAPHLPGVSYVTHGIDLSRFPTVTRTVTPGAPLVVGWAGNRASPAKGFEQFIQPLGAVPGVQLVLCGYSDRHLAIDEMPAFYAGLDVYICSSSTEGNNNALLEAAASGCAIITTDNGTVPEYLIDGEAALVVPRTAAAFRDAVIRLRDDVALRVRLGAAAAAAVRPAWGWDEKIHEYRAFLQQAIDGRAAAEVRMAKLPSVSEHEMVLKAVLTSLHRSLASGDRDHAATMLQRLLSLDPTNHEFRKLYRDVQAALTKLAA